MYVIKYTIGSEVHRLSFPLKPSLSQIKSKIYGQAIKVGSPIYFSYYDGENDLITVKNDNDLDECFDYFQSIRSRDDDTAGATIIVRLDVDTSDPILSWNAAFRKASESLPSVDDIKSFSQDKYKMLESALQELSSRAEEGAANVADVAQRFHNEISHFVKSEEFPFLTRIQAIFHEENLEEIQMSSGSSRSLRVRIQNSGSKTWPSDTKLSLTMAGSAISMPVGSVDLGAVEPGDCISIMIDLTATSLKENKTYYGFWKIASQGIVIPYLLLTKATILIEPPKESCLPSRTQSDPVGSAEPSSEKDQEDCTGPVEKCPLEGFVELRK